MGAERLAFPEWSSSAPKSEVPAPSKVDGSVKVPLALPGSRGPGGIRGLNSTGAVSVTSSRVGQPQVPARPPGPRGVVCSQPSSTSAGLGLPTKVIPLGVSLRSWLLSTASSTGLWQGLDQGGVHYSPLGRWSGPSGWADQQVDLQALSLVRGCWALPGPFWLLAGTAGCPGLVAGPWPWALRLWRRVWY